MKNVNCACVRMEKDETVRGWCNEDGGRGIAIQHHTGGSIGEPVYGGTEGAAAVVRHITQDRHKLHRS